VGGDAIVAEEAVDRGGGVEGIDLFPVEDAAGQLLRGEGGFAFHAQAQGVQAAERFALFGEGICRTDDGEHADIFAADFASEGVDAPAAVTFIGFARIFGSALATIKTYNGTNFLSHYLR